MCTVDVNKDNFDDLMVGAPMYSAIIDKSTQYAEVGAVLIFLGQPGRKVVYDINKTVRN